MLAKRRAHELNVDPDHAEEDGVPNVTTTTNAVQLMARTYSKPGGAQKRVDKMKARITGQKAALKAMKTGPY